MDRIVSLGKALSDPARVRILNLLLSSEACVCELVDALEMGQSSVSNHLQVLRTVGVVQARRKRTWVIYSLSPETRPVIQSAFAQYGPSGRMARDLERMSRRLGLRVDDCCVLGAGQLKEA
jgi:ArsR family transcriptional regulator